MQLAFVIIKPVPIPTASAGCGSGSFISKGHRSVASQYRLHRMIPSQRTLSKINSEMIP